MKPDGDLELGATRVAAVAAQKLRRRAHKKAGMRYHDGQKRSWWSRAWRGKEEYRKTTDNVSSAGCVKLDRGRTHAADELA